MAIEVPVRKEIMDYESKPLIGLTKRQLICLGISAVLGIGTYIFSLKVLDTTNDTASSITIILVLPIFFIGFFKKNGYHFEQYIKILIAHRFRPQRSVYKTHNVIYDYMNEEIENDLSTKMSNYTDRKTTAEEEANITYHLTKKREKEIIKQAKKECILARKENKKYVRSYKRNRKKEMKHNV